MTKSEAKKIKFKMPHVYVLLFSLIVIVFVATFIIPSGAYNRVEDINTGRIVVEAGSYQIIEKTNLGVMDLFMSIIEGMIKASNVIFLVLTAGGAFQIIIANGVFEALISFIADKFGDREYLIIPVFAVVFSIFGFAMGSSQEIIMLVPIGVAVARAVGFDTMTGVAMTQLSTMAGFTAGLFNPFNVGVAQGLAGLDIYSGLWYRVILLVVLVTTVTAYNMRYAFKVKKDPSLSLTRELEEATKGVSQDTSGEKVKMTKTHLLIILTFVVGMSVFIWGVRTQNWFINEMSAIFVIIGILVGIIGRMDSDTIAITFIEGTRDMVSASLMVGLATAIVVVLEKAVVLDTIVNGIFQSISIFPQSLQAVGIYFSQIFINFFIISGTGQAAVVMPVLVPLGDLLGLTRQTIVLAFQLGDGPTNSFFPTSATLMAVLAVAGVRYDRWIKYVAPLMGILTIIGAIFVYVATLIGYN